MSIDIKMALRILRIMPEYIYNMFLFMLKIRKIKPPPIFIPFKLLNQYTLNGKVYLSYLYSDGTYSPDKPIVYTKKMVNSYIEKVRNKDAFYYKETDVWLHQALERYGVKDKEVAIVGSVTVLYESICIFYGGKPTTIEYNKIITEDARLKTMTMNEYYKHPIRFDAAFSISSFEHDGLGRYGGNLSPDGDLVAMKRMRLILKPKGLMFLAVPVGKDALLWNAHRIYGKIRLPLLLRGWEALDRFGFSEDLFESKLLVYEQPVFVLRNLSNS